ncbi:MAG: shikimate kinase AroK [Gammaproteobacteria bacterium]|nr:shikimate kinase AroK [Gammaproteobacteria bacterium]MDH4256782.1 shikimate kinase AroK [Gammaproteobacteria bacterium]MDH5311539.1 shikimate kinase AroK [Gammaproteobacteria bacterium]
MAPKNVFLVGPMGAGKSAVGRQLAKALHLEFIDSDEEIERRTGVDIPFIFEKEGETGFRKREARIIEDLTAQQGIVLATGGGAILDPSSRNWLGARGFVVYLQTSVDQQLERTRRGRERPLLDDPDPRGVLERLMQLRDPLYREIADLVVDTDGRKVTAVTRQIQDALVQDAGDGAPAGAT